MTQATADKKKQNALQLLKAMLHAHAVETIIGRETISFKANNKTISFFLQDEHFNAAKIKDAPVLPLDYLVTMPEKISGIVLSKLNLNTVVFARQCHVKKNDRPTAEKFLETYHLLNATQSAYNLGLFYNNELVALASFSKGRKMNRLPDDKRSFEMIRFCCKAGITITGGLTKLLKHFYLEKSAGDIMTYIDKQLSDGSSFARAGFKKLDETAPNYFLIDKTSFQRIAVKNKDENFDAQQFYLAQNAGNIKMIYHPLP